jgi:hypothetical protein
MKERLLKPQMRLNENLSFNQLLESVSEDRRIVIQKLHRSIINNLCVVESDSLRGINSKTCFEKDPPILFGIGVGGKEPSKGLPFDVLSMILTAEQTRRITGNGQCYILCADDAAITNIRRRDGFTQEKITRTILAKKELLQLVVDILDLSDHFTIFLGSEISKIINKESKNIFNDIVSDISSNFEEGQYFALETAQMYSLIGNGTGGIKIGWYAGKLEKYSVRVFDEQWFDIFYREYCRNRSFDDNASLFYVKAGVSLRSEKNNIIKEAPYTTYDPTSRLLLRPDEQVIDKLDRAISDRSTNASRYIEEYYLRLAKLFREVILDQQQNADIQRTIPEEIQSIYNFIFERNEDEAKRLWDFGFKD